ncbi:MAG: sigma-70 family RNA polymerase sigma factor [Deltaproteobacteria bacterium]|jgi:RNA polymerase sigma-32 factor
MGSSTSHYIASALATPRLSREEELELTTLYKASGSKRAAERLARAHLKQVVHVAMRYRGYGASMSDLIAAGNLGLVHALAKFEPERGLRFATYAEHWVRAYVVREMLRGRSIVRVGGRALETDTFFKVRRDHARWVGLVGEGDALERLAEEYGITEDEASALVTRVSSTDASLNAEGADERSTAWLDRIPDEDATQEERVERAQLWSSYAALLERESSKLGPRERDILQQRLLADEGEEASLAELGEKYNLSRERIRQIEVDVKKKLRARLAVPYRKLTGQKLAYVH